MAERAKLQLPASWPASSRGVAESRQSLEHEGKNDGEQPMQIGHSHSRQLNDTAAWLPVSVYIVVGKDTLFPSVHHEQKGAPISNGRSTGGRDRYQQFSSKTDVAC